MLRGAIHLHSTYSDGEFTLSELKKFLLAARCSFALVTDHADAFDSAKRERYERECAALSGPEFQFVPGLEYGCERRMHILGYGTTALCERHAPEDVIAHIRSHGGIAVIAHPSDEALDWIASFAVLPDGVEVWSSKYDGRYAPRPQVFRLLAHLQQRHPEIRAFYGPDLHWRRQCCDLLNVIEGSRPAADHILQAFRTGKYCGIKGNLELPSSGILPPELMKHFGDVQARSKRFRRYVAGTKKILDRAGVAVPSIIKSQLRRVF